jgi:BASS family bile acid:Na+ symporter
MNIATLLPYAFQASLVLIVLATGMTVRGGEGASLLRQPALLARSALTMQVFAPLLAAGLASTLPIGPGVRTALVALAVSPAPLFVPPKDIVDGGQRSFGAWVVAASTILSVLIIPLTLSLLADVVGVPLAMTAAMLEKRLLLTVMLPLISGWLIARAAPAFSAAWAGAIGGAGSLLLVIGMVLPFATLLQDLDSLATDGTLLVMASYASGALLIGHLMGGSERGNRSVLAVSTPARHPAITIAIAQTSIAGEQLVTPALLLLVVVTAVVTGTYLLLMRRRRPASVMRPMLR